MTLKYVWAVVLSAPRAESTFANPPTSAAASGVQPMLLHGTAHNPGAQIAPDRRLQRNTTEVLVQANSYTDQQIGDVWAGMDKVATEAARQDCCTGSDPGE